MEKKRGAQAGQRYNPCAANESSVTYDSSSLTQCVFFLFFQVSLWNVTCQRVTTMASWGEDLNEYVRQKSHAAVSGAPTFRYCRGAGAPVSTREYNILTNEHHQDERSLAIVQSQQAKSEGQVKRAIAKELRAANHGYNILNMSPKYGMSEAALAEITKKSGGDSHKGKMILPTPGASYLHPFATEFVGEGGPKEEQRQPRRPRPQRPTNIINHKYLVNNDERVAQEKAALLHRLEVKAVVDAPQNPLTGKFRNLEVELAAQQATADKEATRRHLVATQSFKVSHVVGRSEGHAYNILASDQVFHEERLNDTAREKVRGLPQRAALRQAWEHRRDADEALFDADGSRKLARTNPERVLEQMRRGHDAITNRDFGLSRAELAAGSMSAVVGAETAKPPMPMSALRQPTVIERLSGPRPTIPSAAAAEAAATQVVRAEGPRSTHERVFNNVTTTAPNLGSTYTYDGRRALLLPSLGKSTTEKAVRDFQ
jgi:hypothetical protein